MAIVPREWGYTSGHDLRARREWPWQRRAARVSPLVGWSVSSQWVRDYQMAGDSPLADRFLRRLFHEVVQCGLLCASQASLNLECSTTRAEQGLQHLAKLGLVCAEEPQTRIPGCTSETRYRYCSA